MSRKTTRNAQGSGTIRQRPDGRWEARYVEGTDPGTGKQIRRSIYGASEREVRKKLTAITHSLDTGTYNAPQKMTVSSWLNIWLNEFVTPAVKPLTLSSYKNHVNNHIKPAFGAVELQGLKAHLIQQLYNSLLNGSKDKKPLSPKSIKNLSAVLHKSLGQAVKLGYIVANPAAACELPRVEKKEIKPLEQDEMTRFLKAIDNERYKNLFTVTLFTGMRQGEVMGLSWSNVDFERGQITISQQLQKAKDNDRAYYLASTKSGKVRTITPAPFVMQTLRAERAKQAENKLRAGQAWNNPDNLVFTDELGNHFALCTVYKHFKRIASSIGVPEARFHDLRHTYATAALSNGDDIKTVQSNLGHATASFTLDVYAHASEKMKQDSADRMQRFIMEVSKRA